MCMWWWWCMAFVCMLWQWFYVVMVSTQIMQFYHATIAVETGPKHETTQVFVMRLHSSVGRWYIHLYW